MKTIDDSNDQQWKALWSAYSEACSLPGGGPDFLSQVWLRIESRQNSTFASAFGNLGRWLCVVCAAVCLAVGVLNVAADRGSLPHTPAVTSESYADALIEDTSAERTSYTEAIRTKLPADYERR